MFVCLVAKAGVRGVCGTPARRHQRAVEVSRRDAGPVDWQTRPSLTPAKEGVMSRGRAMDHRVTVRLSCRATRTQFVVEQNIKRIK